MQYYFLSSRGKFVTFSFIESSGKWLSLYIFSRQDLQLDSLNNKIK